MVFSFAVFLETDPNRKMFFSYYYKEDEGVIISLKYAFFHPLESILLKLRKIQNVESFRKELVYFVAWLLRVRD